MSIRLARSSFRTASPSIALALIGSVLVDSAIAQVTFERSPEVAAQSFQVLLATGAVLIEGYGAGRAFLIPETPELSMLTDNLRALPSTPAIIAVLDENDAKTTGLLDVEMVARSAVRQQAGSGYLKVKLMAPGDDVTNGFVSQRCLCPQKAKYPFLRATCDIFRLLPAYPAFTHRCPIQVSYKGTNGYCVAFLSRSRFRAMTSSVRDTALDAVLPPEQPVFLVFICVGVGLGLLGWRLWKARTRDPTTNVP